MVDVPAGFVIEELADVAVVARHAGVAGAAVSCRTGSFWDAGVGKDGNGVQGEGEGGVSQNRRLHKKCGRTRMVEGESLT